jgi:hypothetical protein
MIKIISRQRNLVAEAGRNSRSIPLGLIDAAIMAKAPASKR